MDQESEGGQFTTRGMFAFVAGCAIVAAILRFATISFSSMAAGFALGAMIAMIVVFAGTAIDAIERRAQIRWANARSKEPLDAAIIGAESPSPQA